MLAAKRSTSEIKVAAHILQYISHNPSTLVWKVARNIADRGSKAMKPNSLSIEEALWLLTLRDGMGKQVFE